MTKGSIVGITGSTLLHRKTAITVAEVASKMDFDEALQYLAGLNMEGNPL